MPPVVRFACASEADFPEGKVGMMHWFFPVTSHSILRGHCRGIRPPPVVYHGRADHINVRPNGFGLRGSLRAQAMNLSRATKVESTDYNTHTTAQDTDFAGLREVKAGEVDSGLKRKRATSDDGAGTSKRVRHVSRKRFLCAGDAWLRNSPLPQTILLTADDHFKEGFRDTVRKALGYTSGSSYGESLICHCAAKPCQMRRLRQSLRRSYAQTCRGKNCSACQGRARAPEFCDYKQLSGCEEKLRKLILSMDEELTLTCWSPSAAGSGHNHGLRLAAQTFESQSQAVPLGCCKCALATCKAESWRNCMKKKLLTVPAA
ncbi:hypothetical protein Tco_0017441 [Tanacetum coccineum]